MEAWVAVDPPATGSGSTRSSDGDAMGANHAPDTCDDGGTLDPLPSRSPSHLGVAMRALRCRWVSRANPHSPLQLDGFAARAVRVCGAVDPAGWRRGPCRLHPDQDLMCSGSFRPLKRRQTKATSLLVGRRADLA